MKLELENLVRAGKFDEALKALQKIKFSKLERTQALECANIASRIGQLSMAMKILNPLLFKGKGQMPVCDSEIIQYANLLRKFGAVSEATSLLERIDRETTPDVNLILAYCEMTQWRYDQALPHLHRYLGRRDLDPYKKNVAQVNLLAALIHEGEFEKANFLLNHLLDILNAPDHAFLLGSVHELAAQLAIQSEAWDDALLNLEKSRLLLQHAGTSAEALYTEKWEAIVESSRIGQPSRSLFQVLASAKELRQWETVRDCDYYIAKLTDHGMGLVHLYFGTPFVSYRRRLLEALGGPAEIPESYLWSRDSNEIPEVIFDLLLACTDNGKIRLPIGQILHRCLIVLCQDFYRPVPLISLFSRLFPSERFDPLHSPNRVYQLLKRLRKWIAQSGLGLQIQENLGGYQLSFSKPIAIRIPREFPPLDSEQIEIQRLNQLLPQDEFKVREVSAALSLSRSETHRLLQAAVKLGVLRGVGSTTNRRYQRLKKGPSES